MTEIRDLNYKLKNTDGEVILQQKPTGKTDALGRMITRDGDPLTLKKACINALDLVGEEKIEPEEKYRRGKLIEKFIEANNTIELKAEDIALLKKQIGKLASPTVVFQAFNLLDPPKRGPKLTPPKK